MARSDFLIGDILATGQQVIHALKWNAIGRLSAQLVSWAITLLVMRMLAPGDYGLMSLAMMLTGFFALFNDLGVTPALIQKREIDDPLIRNIYGLLLLSNCILYIIIFSSAPYFAIFFNQPQLTDLVRVCGIMLPFGALAAIPSALLQRQMRFKSISLIDLASAITGSVTTLLLAYSGFGVWSLVIGNFVIRVVSITVLLTLTRFRMIPRFDFIGLGSVLSFGTKMSAAQIVWYISANVDGILIGRVLGSEALGFYSVAYNLAMLPASKITSLSSQIAFAAYSRMQDERARASKYFQESVALASLVFFPVCCGMSVVADDLVAVALGPKWQPAAIVLQIVALSVPYRAFANLVNPVVSGIGEPGVALKNTLTTFLILSSGLIAGIYWGLTGLCIGGLIAAMISVTINLHRSLSLLNIPYAQLLAILFPSMFASAVMYATVLIARHGALGGFSAATRLPLEIGLGVVIYGALTLALNRSAVIRSLQLIRGSY
jgi:teichuronic acid exporter